MPSQNYADPLHVGELSLGIILLPEHRGKGYARQVVQQALKVAFSDHTCHRVQVVIIGGANKERNLKLFTHAGFSHEGTRERAFCHPYDHNTWKDVTYMGILATDWLIPDVRRQRFKAPQSLWDELLSRHQREREELIQWDEKRNPTANSLKRTLSTETLRGGLSVQSRSDVEGGDKDVDISTPNESKANPFDDPYSSSASSALYNKKRKLEGKRKDVDEREYNSSDDDDGSVWGAPSLSSLRQIRAQKETEMGLSSGMGARVRSGSVSGASESSHTHSGFSSSPPPPSDTESRHSWDMLDSASDSGDVFSASDDDDVSCSFL
ncbi:hypothetical protein BDQ12DRAFT_599550 [Crucibulum laeve]|uniref:N-acetyltransferase domain-containing protein n=1 Tax=Crucibulum laeve TaxID=68775 RepID=A0A5C3M8Q5_9AGAR|nr:hypothetical protein BDQ12DRAFT_599550 [Crucibulum laeve]